MESSRTLATFTSANIKKSAFTTSFMPGCSFLYEKVSSKACRQQRVFSAGKNRQQDIAGLSSPGDEKQGEFSRLPGQLGCQHAAAQPSICCSFSGKKEENSGIYTCKKEKPTPTSSCEQSIGHWRASTLVSDSWSTWSGGPAHPKLSGALCRCRAAWICRKIPLENGVFTR